MTSYGQNDDPGKWVLRAIGGWIVWNLLSSEARQRITRLIENALAAAEQQRIEQERVRQWHLRQWRLQQQALQQQAPAVQPPSQTPSEPEATVTASLGWGNSRPSNSASASARPSPSPVEQLIAQLGNAWRKFVLHPAVILILGKRGSGKSALAYWLLEMFRYQLLPYVVGVPVEAKRFLPDWISIAPSLEDVPPKSIVLIDEAYLRYHARGSMAAASIEMSRMVNLSRQRGQTLLFVTQEARQVDRNIASSASVVIFKEPSSIQLEFERPELRQPAQEAQAQFGILRGDKRSWSYVYAPDTDFKGMVESRLPSFWTAKLSTLFAVGQGTPARRQAVKPSIAERISRAQKLRTLDFSLSQIAADLGVSKATVINYLRGYPYSRGQRGAA